MSEKTEKATPYRLQKAREQGMVNKSSELSISLSLIALISLISILWSSSVEPLKVLIIQLLKLSTRFSLSLHSIHQLSYFIATIFLRVWLPFAIASLIAIIFTTIAQTGFIWSTFSLTPQFTRLHPMQGFKSIFSSKLIFNLVKNSLKLGLFLGLVIFLFYHNILNIFDLLNHKSVSYLHLIIPMLLKLSIQLLAFLFLFACIDKLYTYRKYNKNTRMSRQELKEEYRQREGDPKIKNKIKLLQRQIRQKTTTLEHVKTADVVITNPTHLAIALRYERTSMPAPKVVCIAQGEMVQHVKLIALQHHVPIINNRAFARSLFATVKLNHWIHQEHFPMAAMIFNDLYRQREKQI